MSKRLRLAALSAAILLGCFVLTLAVLIAGAKEERVEQEVRADQVHDLDGGGLLVHVAPEPPPAKTLRIQSITRYPGGWAVVERVGPGGAGAVASRPTLVRCERLRPATIERRVVSFGTVKAERDARVACEVGGRVLQVYVQLGQVVEAGAPLVELDPRDAELGLIRARAELASSEASLNRAQVQLEVTQQQLLNAEETLKAQDRERERARTLNEQGIGSSAQLDQAELAWRAASGETTRLRGARQTAGAALVEAQAMIGVAQAQVAVATLARARCTVKAPFAGEIAERLVDEGVRLREGELVARLVSRGRCRVRVHVREQEASELQAGNAAWLTVPGLPALDGAPGGSGSAASSGQGGPASQARRGLPGHVVGVSAAADPQTRKVALDVIVEDPARLLRDGMFARVRLSAGDLADSYLVPDAALVSDEAGDWVYVVSDAASAQAPATVRKARVVLGPRQGEARIVRGGLTGEVELATSGLGLLFDGAPVRRLDAGAPVPLGVGER